MGLDPRQLRHAIALSRHKSYRLAAADLGITQPALTKSIQALEAQLGLRLFDRLPRSVEPTAFGAALAARGGTILGGLAELEAELRGLRGLDLGAVSFGAGPLIAFGSLGSVVGDFVRQHPGVRVRALVRDWPALLEALRRQEIELFVADVTWYVAEPDIEITETMDHRGLFYVRAGHPLVRRRKVGAEEMSPYPIASPRLPEPLLARVRHFLGRDAVAANGGTQGGGWEPEIQSESIKMIESAVLGSDAIGVGPRYAHVARLSARDLFPLPVPSSPLQSRVGVVRLRGRSTSPAARKLIAQILGAVRMDLGAG